MANREIAVMVNRNIILSNLEPSAKPAGYKWKYRIKLFNWPYLYEKPLTIVNIPLLLKVLFHNLELENVYIAAVVWSYTYYPIQTREDNYNAGCCIYRWTYVVGSLEGNVIWNSQPGDVTTSKLLISTNITPIGDIQLVQQDQHQSRAISSSTYILRWIKRK